MAGDEGKGLDILGLKPLSEAALHITKSTVDGAAAFLGRVCLPAAEEMGFLLRDKVSAWRKENATAILNAAERKLNVGGNGGGRIHPRLVHMALEDGSWSDDTTLQEMWGGILASSASVDEPNDGNITYLKILAELTTSQAKVLAWACEASEKRKGRSGLVMSWGQLVVPFEKVYEISGLSDVHVLDVELDRLRTIGLIQDGLSLTNASADLTPTSLALNFYARCQGWPGSAIDYFQVQEMSEQESAQFPISDEVAVRIRTE